MFVYSSMYRLIALNLLCESLCESVGDFLMAYFICLSVARLRQRNMIKEHKGKGQRNMLLKLQRKKVSNQTQNIFYCF